MPYLRCRVIIPIMFAEVYGVGNSLVYFYWTSSG